MDDELEQMKGACQTEVQWATELEQVTTAGRRRKEEWQQAGRASTHNACAALVLRPQRASRRRCMPSAHCSVSFIVSAARTSSRLPMRGATDTRKRPRMAASAAVEGGGGGR